MNNEQTAFQTPSVTSKLPSGQAVASFSTLTSGQGVQGAIKPPTAPIPDTMGTQSYAEMTRQALAEAEMATQPLSQERSSLIDQYKQQAGLLEGMAPDAQAIREAQGVTTNTKLVKDIADQILAARTQTDVQKLQKGNLGGITTGMAQNIDQEAERNLAVKNLTLGAQLAAAQGNLALAEDNANRAIEAKYAPIEARINNLKSYLEMNKEELIRVDKKAYEKQTAMLNAKMKDVEEQKAGAEALQKIVVNAASQGAPSSLITRAQGAKNAMEAAAILKEYAGDYYKTQLLKSQIQTEKAQQAKYYADAARIKAETGVNNIPLTATAIKSQTDLQKAVSTMKLTEGNGKALAFAQRAINADKALTERLKTYDPTTVFSEAGRFLETDNAKAFKRDMADFITAVLRKESGATITEDEFDRFIPIYSPQGVFTNKKDIEQTNEKRQGAINALISEAGPASGPLLAYKESMDKESPNVEDSYKTNPFLQALGGVDIQTQGTSIIKQVSDNGNIEFAIPK